jgi:hypothetical protein
MNGANFRNHCQQVELEGTVTRIVEAENLATKILRSICRDKSEMKQNYIT